MPRPRTARVSVAESRTRAHTAAAYLEVADLILGEHDRAEFSSVAAGLAVLAGIAASDAICGRRLGEIHRGADHRAAAELLRRATPDGEKLANSLLRLIDLKDEAHYGVILVAQRKATDAVRRARHLAERAQQEIER